LSTDDPKDVAYLETADSANAGPEAVEPDAAGRGCAPRVRPSTLEPRAGNTECDRLKYRLNETICFDIGITIQQKTGARSSAPIVCKFPPFLSNAVSC